MNNRLLKEYIGLVLEKIILEIGTIGTVSATSMRGSTSTVSSTRSTGTTASESTLGTGSSADKQAESDQKDSISNIEDAVKANSETITNNQKAINTAANKMAIQTNNMISSTTKTADGLSNASTATKDLNKPEQTKDNIRSNIDRQSKGFEDAASGVRSTSSELRKTLTTLQGLQGATKSK